MVLGVVLAFTATASTAVFATITATTYHTTTIPTYLNLWLRTPTFRGAGTRAGYAVALRAEEAGARRAWCNNAGAGHCYARA